jgi:hypothetical protein
MCQFNKLPALKTELAAMSMALTLHRAHFGDEALLPNLGICFQLITMV